MLRGAALVLASQMNSGWSERTAPVRASGFTLIELMIAVGIVAVLTAIAYPSYLRYTIKSNRSAAESYLMDAAQRQQQFLLDSRAYATYTALNDIPPVTVTHFYTVTFATDANGGCTPTPCFILQAAPIAGTMQASDGTLTIDNAGNKSPTNLW
jgi:type IV pilus assembly protein PilE